MRCHRVIGLIICVCNFPINRMLSSGSIGDDNQSEEVLLNIENRCVSRLTLD